MLFPIKMHQCYGRHIVQPKTGLVGIPSIIFSKHVPNKSLRVLAIVTYYVTFNISCDGALFNRYIFLASNCFTDIDQNYILPATS